MSAIDATASLNHQADLPPPLNDLSASTLHADRSPRRLSHSALDIGSKDRITNELVNLDARVEVPDSFRERAQPETQEIPRTASIRKTNNPSLKTTKTGKIQRKTKKIGMNRKSTAYNRFLQQRSKYLSEHFSEWTPQQVNCSKHHSIIEPSCLFLHCQRVVLAYGGCSSHIRKWVPLVQHRIFHAMSC